MNDVTGVCLHVKERTFLHLLFNTHFLRLGSSKQCSRETLPLSQLPESRARTNLGICGGMSRNREAEVTHERALDGQVSGLPIAGSGVVNSGSGTGYGTGASAPS